MFCNGLECISGILVFQDVVKNPELQSQKDFHGEKLSLPGQPPITAHTARVLRQVDGADIPEGGCVGGDAWFGSMMSLLRPTNGRRCTQPSSSRITKQVNLSSRRSYRLSRS
jgi:hypothetical protein